MTARKVKVTVAFDREAHVWFVKDSDLHGLNVEGPTIDALIGKLPGAVTDLLGVCPSTTIRHQILKQMESKRSNSCNDVSPDRASGFSYFVTRTTRTGS